MQDPTGWSLKEWIELADGPTIAVFLLWLNFRGALQWSPQVNNRLAELKASYELRMAEMKAAFDKFEKILIEQADKERRDKNAWKDVVYATKDITKDAVELLKQVDQ